MRSGIPDLKWFVGNTEYTCDSVIFLAVRLLLFIPFGLLFPSKDIRFALIAGVIFSIVIEIIQYFACLGLCELDDVICNGLGTFLGFRMFAFVQKFIKRSNREHGAE